MDKNISVDPEVEIIMEEIPKTKYFIKYVHPENGPGEGTFHTSNLKHVAKTLKDNKIAVMLIRRESDGKVVFSRGK